MIKTFEEMNSENFLQYDEQASHLVKILGSPIIFLVGKVFIINKFKEADSISHRIELEGLDVTRLIHNLVNTQIQNQSTDSELINKIDKIKKIKLKLSPNHHFILIEG